jgi:hypothetical protein
MQDLTFGNDLSSDNLVIMHLLDPDSEGHSSVEILRISVDWIELISPISVLPGTLIQLRQEDRFLLCEARCCHASGSTFQIGADVQDAFLTHAVGSFHLGPEDRTVSLAV